MDMPEIEVSDVRNIISVVQHNLGLDCDCGFNQKCLNRRCKRNSLCWPKRC